MTLIHTPPGCQAPEADLLAPWGKLGIGPCSWVGNQGPCLPVCLLENLLRIGPAALGWG